MYKYFSVLIFIAALATSLPAPALADEADEVTAKVEKLLPGAPKKKVPAETGKTTVTTVTTTTACGEVGAMDRMLMKERKLAFLATSIDHNEAVHIYFINRQNGDWVEMVMGSDLNACIVNEGVDWNFAVGR